MQFNRLVVFSILMVLLSACNLSLVADVAPPPGYQPLSQVDQRATSDLLYPLVPPDSTKGEEIYLEECSPCHGRTGTGDGPNSASLPVPVTAIGDQTISRQATPAEWFRVLSQGKSELAMPSFNFLTDRQRWDVIAYTLKLNVSDQDLAHGLELFEENCSGCHSIHDESKSSDTANQKVPDFTDQESMARKSTTDFYKVITNGSGSQMPSFMDQLSEVERWEVAQFVRSQSFSPTPLKESDSSVNSLPESKSITPANSATTLPGASVNHELGEITGKVINASGGDLLPGLEITLHAFDQMLEVYTNTTVMKENGVYLFDGIDMQAGRTFMTSAEFDGVVYSSEQVSIKENQKSVELPLKIYQITKDASVLRVDHLHFFFELLPGEYSQVEHSTVHVVELYVISNPSTKTLIAPQEDQPVVSFHLPPGASNLELQDGNLDERYMRTSDGFGDTIPVLPGIGNYQVMFSYTVPYSSDLSLSWPVKLPIMTLLILVPGDDVIIEGLAIHDVGLQDFEGMQYHEYEGNNFSPGQELSLSITRQNLGKRIAISTGYGSNLLIGLATLVVSLTFAAVWIFHQDQKEKPKSNKYQTRQIKPAEENPETIMDAILALDDLYREGSLPEDAYLQRRFELKNRLKEMIGR